MCGRHPVPPLSSLKGSYFLFPTFGLSTELRQPQRHAAVDLIQDQDDHQVDDNRRGRHRHPDVGFGLRVGAHGHQGRHGDAVDDDAEDGGKGQAKLKRERKRKRGKKTFRKTSKRTRTNT